MAGPALAPPRVERWTDEFTEDQIGLIKRTICRPSNRMATDDELALFRFQCERTGLDPFSRRVYAIFRWSSREKREVMTIQVAIDGLRLIAERTGKYLGQTPVEWCAKDSEWTEIWTQDALPFAARVGVYKAGLDRPTMAVARFSEYAPKKKGKLTGLWPQMPTTMIGKCAEALALRKAFPAETSGLYIAEEFERQDAAPPAQVDPQAPPIEAPEGDSLSEERVSAIRDALKAGKLNFGRIKMLFGAVGATAPKISRADSILKALRSLTAEQADQFEELLAKEPSS